MLWEKGKSQEFAFLPRFPSDAGAAGPATTFKTHCLNTAGPQGFLSLSCVDGHLALKLEQPWPAQGLSEGGNQQAISLKVILLHDCTVPTKAKRKNENKWG